MVSVLLIPMEPVVAALPLPFDRCLRQKDRSLPNFVHLELASGSHLQRFFVTGLSLALAMLTLGMETLEPDESPAMPLT